jgi:PhoPQ-activated pathogenicity-related protein
MVGASLYQVPNQPIFFREEKPVPQSRQEDGIIAWTWEHLREHTADTDWVLRLPMTKAAVRAMDTLTQFVNQKIGTNPQKYIVAGASKRGWTTWVTSAVDKRVVAAIPMVMDDLNFVKNVHHHFRAYGGAWSYALQDYYATNMTIHLDEPEFQQQLMAIEDPITYKDRLTMPKLVVCASGDEFFLPDDTRFWWDQMPGENMMLMLPNTPHSLSPVIGLLLPAGQAWIAAVIDNKKRPQMTWIHNDVDGAITLLTDTQPLNVSMWYAMSPLGVNRRDFRLSKAPKRTPQDVPWVQVMLTEQAKQWIATAPRPAAQQWTGFYIEVIYPPLQDSLPPMRYTTSVGVFPATYPAADCFLDSCLGTLV